MKKRKKLLLEELEMPFTFLSKFRAAGVFMAYPFFFFAQLLWQARMSFDKCIVLFD